LLFQEGIDKLIWYMFMALSVSLFFAILSYQRAWRLNYKK
jgi:hypothetical protein